MKKLYLLLILLVLAGIGFGQTTLSVGDIAITGVNMDNPDEISVVFLVDIQSGTEISFTDKGWHSNNTWRTGEGIETWIASSAYSAGDEIVIALSRLLLSSSGDQVIAYQNTADMIGAINDDGNHAWQSDATSSNTSALPQGLTNGTNCVALAETDNIIYDRSITSGTKAEILSAINDYTKWRGNNSVRQTLSTAGFTITGSGAPVDPTTFTATASSTTQIDLSWTQNTNSNNVMIAWSSDGTFGTPADGTTYAANDGIVGGGTVLYNGNTTTYQHTSLTSGKHYYYKAWSVDGALSYSGGVAANASTDKVEPTNQVASFAAGTPTAVSIPLTWLDNDGVVAADSLLLMINKTGTFAAPVDGVAQSDDLDLSDGTGRVNVAHGSQSYTWTNLAQGTHYYFTIYPFTNSGTAIDYKTDGTVPIANASTTSANTDLIISEVADPSDNTNARFVEIYNAGSTSVDFSSETWYLTKEVQTGSIYDVRLTGTIASGSTYVVAKNYTEYNTAYNKTTSQASTYISGNGDDSYKLYYGGDHSSGTLIDIYGVGGIDGTGTAWEYSDGKAVRKYSVSSPSTTWTAAEWVITRPASVTAMSPGWYHKSLNWNGGSTAWGTSANWTDGGGASSYPPDAGANVTIAATANSPVISSDASCNDLTISSGAMLTISSENYLTVAGNLTNQAGSEGLVIQSDASGNGSLIFTSGTPDATIQRYTPAYSTSGNGWHEIGCPLTSMTVSATDWNPIGTNNDLYSWSESDNLWKNYKAASFDFAAGNGYLAASETDLTHHYTGALNNRNITISNLSYTDGKGSGWHLLGNPFASAIKWNDGNWTLTNVAGTAKVWDYTNNPGNYMDVAANGIIPSTNGFFVQVLPGTTGSVTIPKAACAHNTTNNYKTTPADSLQTVLCFKVSNDENIFTDITTLGFRSDATKQMDPAFDSHKLFGDPNAPQLWTVSDNENFSSNYLLFPTRAEDIPLHFKAGVNTTYHLAVSGLDSLEDNHLFYLEDLKTGDIILLNKQSGYDFTGIPDDDINRFVLHINGVTAIPNISKTEGQPLVYTANHQLIVKNTAKRALQGMLEVYDLSGRCIAKHDMNTTSLATYNLQAMPGIYLVKIATNDSRQFVRKIFIK